MKTLSVWVLLLVVGSGAWAGYIDTDGYYLMDALELSAWDGATSGTAAVMAMNGPNGTISGISAGGSWWLQFSSNFALLPTDLSGATGWKLTFENTSTTGYLNIVLVAQTATSSWIQGNGYGCNPGETTTAYLDLTGKGPEAMTNFFIILSVDGSADVLSFKAIGAEDKGRAWNPNPEDDPDGSTASVFPEAVLMWNTAMVKDPNERPNPAIRKHYVFSNINNPSDPNLFYIGEVDAGDPVEATVQYPVSGVLNLDPLTVYKWRIDEGLDDGNGGVLAPGDPNNIIGNVWTFKTASNEPIVTKDPIYTAVFPAETATLTANFFSLSPIIETHWYWSGDNGATFTELTNGAHPSGSGSMVAVATNEGSTPKTTTLTITEAQAGDDGWYYCTLTNSEGQGQSANAGLVIKRLVAYYPFNDDLTDASGEGNDGVARSENPGGIDLGYAAGVAGNAVVLNANTDSGDPNQTYIELPVTGYPKAAPGGAMEAGTILFWYKTWSWGRLMGSANADPDPTAFTVGLDVNFDVYINGVSNLPNDPMLAVTMADNTWHFGAARWQLGGENRLYEGHLGQNGISSAAEAAAAMTAFNDLDYPMLIGAENWRGTLQSFLNNTLIDELRIYNYPLTDVEITDIYNSVSGHGICVAGYASSYDFNGDCIVSLSDFTELAANWLSCGILPDTACGN